MLQRNGLKVKRSNVRRLSVIMYASTLFNQELVRNLGRSAKEYVGLQERNFRLCFTKMIAPAKS
jgi:hypothetical protein